MGNKRRKRIFCAGLGLALAIGLCACGAGGEESTDVKSTNGGSQGGGSGSAGDASGASNAPGSNDRDAESSFGSTGVKTNANTGLAKENVYRVSEIEFPRVEESDNIEALAYHDGRIYAAMKVYDWDNGHKYYIFSADESGNVLSTAFLALPGRVDGEEEAEETAKEPDPNVWETEDTRYSDFTFGPDGRVYALRQYQYTYVNYLTDRSTEEQHEYLCCWDEDGSLLWQTETPEDSGEGLSVWAVLPEEDGSLELLLTGEKAYRVSVGKDGSLSEAGKKSLSEETAGALSNCRRLLRRKDGACLLLCREGEGLSLTEYELQTDTLGESFVLPENISAANLSNTAFSPGEGSDLTYGNASGVYTWNMGDEQSRLKMSYINSDRNITDVRALQELDETHFVMFYQEDYGRALKAGVFEYTRPEDIPDKAVLVLAGLNVNGVKTRVVQYNRSSDKYRVLVKEYETSDALHLDMVSGKMPDIILVQGPFQEEALPMDSYIAKGLIADVGKLIEEDEELSRTDYLENVFEAYSVDGRLMYVVPSFTFSTMAARSSLVEDEEGWSVERALAVLEEMGGDARLMDGLSRDTFMEKVMEYRGNDFIDVKTGKCTFDSPEFIELMKYARTLPEERSYAGWSGEGEYELQYLKNRTLLMELGFGIFGQDVDERLFYRLNGYLGGEYSLVGFPAVSGESAGETESGKGGSGAYVQAVNRMALSAVSDDLEGAWDFARYYLTEEYQKSLESSLPVNRRLFEEWAEEETRRSYYINENGEKVEYDLYMDQGGSAAAVPPLDREQLDELIAYVESVTATPFEDKIVMNIISEELGSYFSGQKTAEDAAALIQNRVQMYVLENQ
ncbi:MAG: extracellular solute-binding protein [Firmicutes bacterium]|nr:extracellular solute-binding protein [Bacillota bacterium]